MAMLAEPRRPWRIITSDQHSTVWDGERMLFEFNFQAFGIPADECFACATDPQANPKELKPGEEQKVGYPEHYTVERDRYLAEQASRANGAAANDNYPAQAIAA